MGESGMPWELGAGRLSGMLKRDTHTTFGPLVVVIAAALIAGCAAPAEPDARTLAAAASAKPKQSYRVVTKVDEFNGTKTTRLGVSVEGEQFSTGFLEAIILEPGSGPPSHGVSRPTSQSA